ncbi:MAG TPA: alkaline phosphatase D family protein [Thermoleophilaceae bacterium]|jgi:alkaline phosphatase D
MDDFVLSRRRFLASAGGFAATTVFAPQVFANGLTSAKKAPKFSGGSFPDGVISGDPGQHGITLWTRVAGVGGAGRVELEVAKDSHFKHVVARTDIATNVNLNHTAKARIAGLKPHSRYFYRFSTKNHHSPVGRFQTMLPADSHETVRFAYFSCMDYTHGFYNAFDLMATEDIDFMVGLGDYIYDEAYHSIADGTGVRDDTIGPAPQAGTTTDFHHQAITLDEYRQKYKLYRTDKALRKVHSLFPYVTTWDDHEVQDNYAGHPSDGGLPPQNQYSVARKRAAYRAFFESMPLYDIKGGPGDRIYRSLPFGRNVELIMLDERQYRDNQPCDDQVVPPCTELPNKRAFLGSKQMKFLKQRLKHSKAAWKIIGNEVMIMDTKVGPNTYFGYDSWQGYPGEREELAQYIHSQKIDDVIFITGDIHTFVTGDVKTNGGTGDPAGIEFVGGSITSAGLGESNIDLGGGNVLPGNDQNPNTPPSIINALRGFNPWVDQADFDHHGYGVVKASKSSLDVRLRRMKTIKQHSKSKLPDFHYVVKRGQKSIIGKSS